MGLVEVEAGPQRSLSIYQDTAKEIQEEMLFTCLLLKEWRRWRPVVAGGAIWSWAAGKPCNDVDIFVQSTRWSRRKALHQYGYCDSNKLLSTKSVHSSYLGRTRDVTTEMPIERYKTLLPGCPVPVDFNLTPWKGAEVCRHFDYLHCVVAFGPKIMCTTGVEFYQKGLLEPQHSGIHAREKDYVMGKIQPSLWGKIQAGDHARRVLIQLQKLYAEL